MRSTPRSRLRRGLAIGLAAIIGLDVLLVVFALAAMSRLHGEMDTATVRLA
jgi:hypothetical protein